MELLGGRGGKTSGLNYRKLTAASQFNEMLLCLPGSLFMHIRCDPLPF